VLLMLYGVFRIFVEFLPRARRAAGIHRRRLYDGSLLSLPMLVAGIWLVMRALRAERQEWSMTS